MLTHTHTNTHTNKHTHKQAHPCMTATEHFYRIWQRNSVTNAEQRYKRAIPNACTHTHTHTHTHRHRHMHCLSLSQKLQKLLFERIFIFNVFSNVYIYI